MSVLSAVQAEPLGHAPPPLLGSLMRSTNLHGLRWGGRLSVLEQPLLTGGSLQPTGGSDRSFPGSLSQPVVYLKSKVHSSVKIPRKILRVDLVLDVL